MRQNYKIIVRVANISFYNSYRHNSECASKSICELFPNFSIQNLLICPKNRIFDLNKSDYVKSDYSGHIRS